MSREYVTAGQALLVCPNLIAIDARHGLYSSKRPPCWDQPTDGLGNLVDDAGLAVLDHKARPWVVCRQKHDHGPPLEDPEGHTSALFVWVPGCRPPEADWPTCALCGELLIHTDLDHPLDEAHLRPLADSAPQIG